MMISFEGHDLLGQQEYDDEAQAATLSTSPIAPLYTTEAVYNWLKNNYSKDIQCITLHHTYAPTTSRGIGTMYAIRKYHMSHGFSDIAANFYATDEEGIIGYTARALSKQNGAHAYISKNWDVVPVDLRLRAAESRQYLNYHSFGLETFGNFDVQDPKTSAAMSNSIKTMAVVCDYYDLDPNKDLYFHNMVEYKTCPGTRVELDWIKQEVIRVMGNGTDCKDLPADEYAEEALQWAKDTGLMVGDGDGNQFPQCNITRQDMIVVLMRYNELVNGT